MLDQHLVPLVEDRAAHEGGGPAVVHSRMLRTTGVTESGLASALQPVLDDLSPVSLAYLPGFDGVDLRLTAWRLTAAQAAAALDEAATRLMPILGRRYYGANEADLAAVVLNALRSRGLTLATAESCTGGLVGARLTAVPGASDVFVGGVIAYADELKRGVLGVPQGLLEAYGAVSEEVAAAMARGAGERFAADAAIAVTGIAGPSGGSDEKPVGTVWLAACVGEKQHVVCRRFPGGRSEVRHRSAQGGLDLLRWLLDG